MSFGGYGGGMGGYGMGGYGMGGMGGGSGLSVSPALTSMTQQYGNMSSQLTLDVAAKVMPMNFQAQQLAATSTLNSVYGNLLQSQMTAVSNVTNINQQLSSLAQRQAMTQMMNQVEQFTYAEMVREKLFNLFADMEKQRFDNAFQRAKSAVQSMKY